MHANSVGISMEAGAVPNSKMNKINKTLEQCPLTENIVPITVLARESSNIPNLNSPTSLTSSTSASMFRSDGHKDYRVNSANKFSVVQDDNEDDSSSSLHNEGMEDSKGYSAKNKKENIGGFSALFCCFGLGSFLLWLWMLVLFLWLVVSSLLGYFCCIAKWGLCCEGNWMEKDWGGSFIHFWGFFGLSWRWSSVLLGFLVRGAYADCCFDLAPLFLGAHSCVP
ncbi:hypothetical protein MA16_Dca005743 [Dendrobium catenatum]|uniref:Uncharacterized protein n=1 Tax=Dendrobium catenatum TaxID=906689 RepID=A0A2I0WX27_9ASPA|nr:hypothetical protein MA16_Dca005743 [Dendrobium catenatum]